MTSSARIIHCIRTPIGGSFRHVCDLMHGQAALGHEVGLICATGMGGEMTERALAGIDEIATLGVHRIAMSRQIGISDFTAWLRIRALGRCLRPHVLHGHGAKGGAYVRLLARSLGALAFYTPHGGSLHYSPASLQGFVYLTLERALLKRTDGLIFESGYSRDVHRAKVGAAPCMVRVIHNGVAAGEFEPVELDRDAAEFLFIGELRHLKGVDVLLHALRQVRISRDARLVVVGSGPDEDIFRASCHELGLDDAVHFAGPLPARAAFARGRTVIVPSRAESLPYIVLEAAAAGKSLIVSNVGGIPEIFGPRLWGRVPAGDADALAQAMMQASDDPMRDYAAAIELRQRIKKQFSVTSMVSEIDRFYRHFATAPVRDPQASPALRFPAE